jgi:hypothetical protein
VSGKPVLADEAQSRAVAQPPSEVRPVAAGDEDDRRRLVGKPIGDLEAAQIREDDVEQDEVGGEIAGESEARGSVACLSDDLEAVRLEHSPRCRAERFVVVHDQDGRAHVRIVTHSGRRRYGARTEIQLGADPDSVSFDADETGR